MILQTQGPCTDRVQTQVEENCVAYVYDGVARRHCKYPALAKAELEPVC